MEEVLQVVASTHIVSFRRSFLWSQHSRCSRSRKQPIEPIGHSFFGNSCGKSLKIGDQNIDMALPEHTVVREYSDEYGFERVTFCRCQVLMFVESFVVVVKLHVLDTA